MAVKKTASSTKAKGASPAPKAAKTKGAAQAEAAPPTTPAAPKAKAKAKAAPAATAKAAPAAAPATKPKAKAKAKAAPIKLSSTQSDLLAKIGGGGETGFLSAKKGEQRTIAALQDRKLVKRGAKDKASGSFHYLISSAGKKFLETSAADTTSPTSANPSTSSGGNS